MIKISPLGVMPMTPNLIDWINYGERDTPTLTMISALTGILIIKEGTHPVTHDDFYNVFELMKKEPLIREKVSYMKFVPDKNWKIISENINDIETWFNECKRGDDLFNKKINNLLI